MKKGVCQCCGRDIISESDFGTNPGGAKNEEYCFDCYKDGMFTQPNLSLQEQINHVSQHFIKHGMSEGEASSKAEKMVKNLKRWKK